MSNSSWSRGDAPEMAWQLEMFAAGLVVVFLASVFGALLPLRLLDPAWQFEFANVLVNNAALPLVALALHRSAAYVNSRSTPLQSRHLIIARIAFVASIGYLLLIPLQGVALWQGIGNARIKQEQQHRLIDRRFAELRRSISAATSTADLQGRLQSFRAPLMAPSQLVRPLPSVKETLLPLIDQSEAQLKARWRTPSTMDLWPVVQQSLRLVVSSFGIAVAFAAGGRWLKTSPTLLEGALHAWRRDRPRSRSGPGVEPWP